jgi:hypothetical protein
MGTGRVVKATPAWKLPSSICIITYRLDMAWTLDSDTGCVRKRHARIETTKHSLHSSLPIGQARAWTAAQGALEKGHASAFLLTYRVRQGMDSGTGCIGKGHARVETTQQHLHSSLPIGYARAWTAAQGVLEKAMPA